MFKSIRQLIAILDPASRVHFLLLLIPMLLMTALEVASIGLILPVIQVLLLGQTDGALTKFIFDFLPAAEGTDQGLWIAILFAVFFAAKNVLMLALIFIINRVTLHKKAVYNRKLFLVYLSRPLAFHFTHNSAHLLRNITSGVGSTFACIRLTLMMGLDGLLMTGAFALLIFAEPMATLGAVAVLGAVGLMYYHIGSPVFRHWGERAVDLEGALIKWINQSFDGIRDVKLLHTDGYLGDKIGNITMAHADYTCWATTANSIPRLLVETVVVIGFLGIVFVLLSAEQNSNGIIGIMGLYGMAAMRLMPSLNRILTSATNLRFRAKFISTVYDDLVACENAAPVDGAAPSVAALPFEDELRVEAVSYAYPGTKKTALKGVGLTIPKGGSVGIVGASGAGKSTLMDIILGLLSPTSGRLLVDGKDVAGNLAGWQRHIGIVPQQIFLMDDTIRRNVAFGIKDEDIDEAALKKALKTAKLDDFLAELPDGLETVLGEHGVRLSGGQRQRIAIARALYRNPDVLMFDEATSALDNETEREITQAIDNLAGEKTVLIIAHRLSTVKNCDQIIFMKDGEIADTGRFDELIKNNSGFAELARLGDLGAETGRLKEKDA